MKGARLKCGATRRSMQCFKGHKIEIAYLGTGKKNWRVSLFSKRAVIFVVFLFAVT
jgi:hypothetical protein